MGSKGVPTTAKKESWREWKTFQEKQEASSDTDTSERSVVHTTGIGAVMSTKNWQVFQVVMIMMSYFLVLEVPPSLRKREC